jgi:hypothetical protein
VPIHAAPRIVVVGGDDAIVYLIGRYAERAGFQVHVAPSLTPDVLTQAPAAVWFSSLDILEAERPRDAGLLGDEAPLLVCTSTADESRARDLGVDHLAVHPLTYSDFVAAMSAVHGHDGRRQAATG